MATVASIKQSTNSRIRIKSQPNTISPGDVADNLDLVTDEVRQRGFIKSATTGGLASISGSNTRYAIVQNDGLYEYSATGTPNGSTIFAAEGSGTWNLIAQFAADLTDKFTISADYEYDLTGYQTDSIELKPSVNQTIKIGYTNGGEDVLMSETITAGTRKSISIKIYGDEHASIFFSGLTANTDISIYRKRL